MGRINDLIIEDQESGTLDLNRLVDAIALVGDEVSYFHSLPRMARMSMLMARASDKVEPLELRRLADLWDAYPQDEKWLDEWRERWTDLCNYLERNEQE